MASHELVHLRPLPLGLLRIGAGDRLSQWDQSVGSVGQAMQASAQLRSCGYPDSSGVAVDKMPYWAAGNSMIPFYLAEDDKSMPGPMYPQDPGRQIRQKPLSLSGVRVPAGVRPTTGATESERGEQQSDGYSVPSGLVHYVEERLAGHVALQVGQKDGQCPFHVVGRPAGIVAGDQDVVHVPERGIIG